ncbi:MAG: terpene utilization protein AtuA, partial [bacterium]
DALVGRKRLVLDRLGANPVFLSQRLEGHVDRYEIPNLGALNFVLHEVLDGGGISSLRSDAQGKALCEALLQIDVEVPEGVEV